jgi:hypothetical protein
MAESCRICKHFVDSGHNVGTCRRYPQFQNRSPNEVCGEFFAKLVAIVPTEDVLPVLEAGTFLPKKRGRPAKVAE